MLLTAIHIGAAVCAGFTPWPRLAQAGIDLALALSLYRALSLHGWRRASAAVTAVEIRAGEVAVRRRKDTAWHAVQVRAAFVHPWVVVLRLRWPGRLWPLSVVIARDALPSEHFRRLCVRLAHLGK